MQAPKRQFIREEWDKLVKAAIHPQISELQRSEMEKCFYAGAASLYNLLIHGVSPGKRVEASDMQMMQDIDIEIRQYFKNLAHGGGYVV